MCHDQTFFIGKQLQISENNKIKDEHYSIFWIKSLSAPQLDVSSQSQSLFMCHDQTFLIGEELQISENNKI